MREGERDRERKREKERIVTKGSKKTNHKSQNNIGGCSYFRVTKKKVFSRKISPTITPSNTLLLVDTPCSIYQPSEIDFSTSVDNKRNTCTAKATFKQISCFKRY